MRMRFNEGETVTNVSEDTDVESRTIAYVGGNEVVSPKGDVGFTISDIDRLGIYDGVGCVEGQPNLLMTYIHVDDGGKPISGGVAVNMFGDEPTMIFYPYDMRVFDSRFVWVQNEPQRNQKVMISERGQYIVNLESEKYVRLDTFDVPTMVDKGVFETDEYRVRWNGGDFEVINLEESSDDTDNGSPTRSSDDNANKNTGEMSKNEDFHSGTSDYTSDNSNQESRDTCPNCGADSIVDSFFTPGSTCPSCFYHIDESDFLESNKSDDGENREYTKE